MAPSEVNFRELSDSPRSTVGFVASTTQQSSHVEAGLNGDAREVVEAWLRADGPDPLVLQADLTAGILDGDTSPLGSEAWRSVCEAIETGWADERLRKALLQALRHND